MVRLGFIIGLIALIGALLSGLAAYRARRWQEAVACFERAIVKRPGGDAAASMLIERCRSYQLEPPGPDWMALTVMGSK